MKNMLKARLKQGDEVIGGFVELGNPDVTELLSRLGFDWLLLDAEHGPLDLDTMKRMLQAMNGTDCVPIVRAPWNDPVWIKQILDIGAYGVVVPWVNSKEEAELVVKACKYPPEGIRGYGPRRAGLLDPDYFATANQEVLVAVQIETVTALENLDEILAVPGLDACYIGPNDLSVSMGLGVPPKWDNPDYSAALERVLEAANKHGKPVGLFNNLDTIEWAIAKGFRFNTVGTADSYLKYGARAALAKAGR